MDEPDARHLRTPPRGFTCESCGTEGHQLLTRWFPPILATDEKIRWLVQQPRNPGPLVCTRCRAKLGLGNSKGDVTVAIED